MPASLASMSTADRASSARMAARGRRFLRSARSHAANFMKSRPFPTSASRPPTGSGAVLNALSLRSRHSGRANHAGTERIVADLTMFLRRVHGRT